MLTENEIISRLTTYLVTKDYKIVQSLKTSQRGIDIIAQNNSHVLHVEAKGETSSKSHTKRFTKPFNKNQISSHVSRAILSSMILLESKPTETKIKMAIALPDNEGHRDLVKKIQTSLKTLGIAVFLVSEENVSEL